MTPFKLALMSLVFSNGPFVQATAKWPETETLVVMQNNLMPTTGIDVVLIQVQGVDYPGVSFQITTFPVRDGQIFVVPYDVLPGKYEFTAEAIPSSEEPVVRLPLKSFTVVPK